MKKKKEAIDIPIASFLLLWHGSIWAYSLNAVRLPMQVLHRFFRLDIL